jgi:hypothetical protein
LDEVCVARALARVVPANARGDDENYYVDRCTAGFSAGFLAALRLCAVLISAICVSACGKLPV